jgi:hypothetical protein
MVNRDIDTFEETSGGSISIEERTFLAGNGLES